ncbi:lipopolysaccharide biosynthesis protein [Sphaerisporangium aureirubrum]|uniref:Lipopolysaccharide biosynthesis protein n=1 Tax=Sphaerisporangium aureirubrum TaxID=1544736 RepID=A0ABW1NI06_9ACTN
MAPLNTSTGIVRGGAAGVTAAVVSAGAQFLLVVAVTRGLDPHAAGVLFTTTALCLMTATVLRLDTGNGLIYFLARSDGPGARLDGYLTVALAPVLALSATVAVVVYGCADGIGHLLLPGSPSAPATLRVLAVALPVITCADVLVAATRGFGTMRPTVLLGGVLQPGGQLVLVGVVALTGVTDRLLAAAWALPYLPVLILGALWLRHHARVAAWSRPVAGEFWRYTAPRAVGGAVQAVFQRLDIVIVAVLAGAEQAAVYTAATRFKVAGQLVGQGLAQAVQPGLVRALADGDLPRARELYQTATVWLVVLTWPIWLGYAALAPWLTSLFGEEYRLGTAVALVLSATMTAATAAGMVDVVLIAAGHTTASMANVLIAITVTVAVDLVLIPSHGALGAALGWSTGVLTKNLLPLIHLSRVYHLRPFGRHTLPALRATGRHAPRPFVRRTTATPRTLVRRTTTAPRTSRPLRRRVTRTLGALVRHPWKDGR